MSTPSPLISLAELMAPISDSEKLDLFFRLLAGAIAARGQPASSVTLEQLAALINKGFQNMSDANARYAAELAQLQSDVTAQSTVIASATTAFQGLSAQLAAAEASARNAGATDAQVAGLAAVRQGLEANTAGLASAIPANTPAADANAGGQPAGSGTAI